MRPTLPGDDPDPGRRRNELEARRGQYTFVWDGDQILSAGELPLSEKDDPFYWAALAKVSAEFQVNRAASRLRGIGDGAFSAYEHMYSTIERPPIVGCWERDDIFAWQMLAGTNPVMLRRLDEPMAHFPVTAGHFRRAVGDGDTLEAALAEGRLYVADYAVLDGLPDGHVDGRRKYGFAPIALFVAHPTGLRPVAIQCGQRPDARTPILTPADGVSWRMARTAVTAADGNVQGIVTHFAMCHQVMEAVILATHRELSERHPVHVLLAPHFRDTLITNDIARKSLYSVGGNMDRLQSPVLDASLGLVRRELEAFRLTESAPHEDFARRGVDDLDALPVYPARDDALLLWPAMRSWVEDDLRLYYTTDAQVGADTELAAWVDALGAEEGGRLRGLTRPQRVEDLVGLVSRILFRCTVFHASINYSSFPMFSFAPNVQTAAFGPAPTGGPADTEEAWRAMVPPIDLAWEAFSLFWNITVQLDHLGGYRDTHFGDPRVAPLLAAHRSALAEAEAVIASRNEARLLAYPWMAPSRVPLSIQV